MLRWIRRKTSEQELEQYKKLMEASEKEKNQSRAELTAAVEVVRILKQIRAENHIVSDLRKVFGGH